MVRQIDAIFSRGAFLPLEPLTLPEGTRVHLSIRQESSAGAASSAARILTPKLAHREDAADFVMIVRETDNASV